MNHLLLSAMNSDINVDNLTAEEYNRLNEEEKLNVEFALLQKYNNKKPYDYEGYWNKLKEISKTPYKIMMRVFKDGKLLGEYERRELYEELNLPEKEVDYIIRYSSYRNQNPKYSSFRHYKIYKIEYVLKGNNYIEIK